MDSFMSDGVNKGWFKPHNKTTAMEIAKIVINTRSDETLDVSEQDMFDRERAAFLNLAKTPETKRWIKAMLSGAEIE
jgi:3-hydroxyacyl-CoA dehydrogenase